MMDLPKRNAIFLLFLAFAGCQSPAAPPAPPAEIPSFLRIPDPTIDVSKIASTAPPESLSALVGSGGFFSEEIAVGGDLIGFINLALEQLLFPFQEIEIPVSPETTAFEATVTIDSTVLGFKFDFSDFDFDDDGINEGCSGCTCPAGCDLDLCPTKFPAEELKPICFRIWAAGTEDPVRMGGVFTAFPTDENPGAGRFKVEGILDLRIGVIYDHRDPLDKSTELFSQTIIDFSLPPGERESLFEAHALVSQIGPDESADKTAILSESFDTSGSGGEEQTGFVQYIGRFREDEDLDLWSGSLNAEGSESVGVPPGHFSNACAFISTGNASNRANCLDLGIDVEGIDFIDFLEDEDVLLPTDFPETPPFLTSF